MKIKYCILVLLAGLIVACQQDEILTFNDVKRIQFGNALTIEDAYDNSGVQNYSYTFVYTHSSTVRDTVYFNVFASGGSVDFDRYFVLRQQQIVREGVVNAQPGIHYVDFNGPETRNLQVIKAGTVTAKCGIILLRDTSLKSSDVQLRFELVASEDFELGNSRYLIRKLVVSDQLTKPNNWDTSPNFTMYFGEYSKVRHQFMIDVTRQKWNDEFIEYLEPNRAELLYWRGVIRKALIIYNDEHPDDPLTDEYGNLVKFD